MFRGLKIESPHTFNVSKGNGIITILTYLDANPAFFSKTSCFKNRPSNALLYLWKYLINQKKNFIS